MKKIDRRVKKTELAIRHSFEELAETHNLHEITVKELTNKADINRKTFYLHYDSINDLINLYVNDISEELITLLNQHTFKEYYENPGEALDTLISISCGKNSLWLKLLFSDEYSYFSRKVENILVKNMTIFILKSFPIDKLDAKICANFLIQNTLTTTRFLLYDLKCKDYNLVKIQAGKLNKLGISYFVEGNGISY